MEEYIMCKILILYFIVGKLYVRYLIIKECTIYRRICDILHSYVQKVCNITRIVNIIIIVVL